MFYKTISINKIYLTSIVSICVFIVLSLVGYYKYIKDPKEFNLAKNKLNLNKNPFQNILNKHLFIIACAEFLFLFTIIYLNKNLPLTFLVPGTLIWLFISIYLEKLILNNKITLNKVFKNGVVVFGVIIAQFHIFGSNNSHNIMIPMIILILNQFIRAFSVTYTKKIETFLNPSQMAIGVYGNMTILSTILLLFYLYWPYKSWEIQSPNKFDMLKTVGFATTISSIFYFTKYYAIKHLHENTFNLITSSKIIFSFIVGRLVFI